MTYLFSGSAQGALRSLVSQRMIYAFDYDGTLSKITQRPHEATVLSSTIALLGELCRHAKVAIVSGRSKMDLETRVSLKQITLIGNHGLEGLDPDPEALEYARALTRGWMSTLQVIFGGHGSERCLEIEDKEFSVSIHYRECSNRLAHKNRLLNFVERLEPEPRVILGKCVVNLLPPEIGHKGAALRQLLTSSNADGAFYIGDDDTDEDVFALLDPRIVTVRVGRKQSSKARFFIENQAQIDRLLSYLVANYRTR